MTHYAHHITQTTESESESERASERAREGGERCKCAPRDSESERERARDIETHRLLALDAERERTNDADDGVRAASDHAYPPHVDVLVCACKSSRQRAAFFTA
jgi:hypothetical protein